MHANAIYNPASTYTQAEREAASARHARLRRIANAARPEPRPNKGPEKVMVLVPGPSAIERWVERQKTKYKAPWFFVVADLGVAKGIGPSIPRIQRAVCLHYGVSLEDMLSPARFAGISLPRQVAVYICRKLTKRGYPELGKRFGDRDHSTQIHACRRISDLIRTDPEVASAVEQIMESLGGGT